MIKIRISYSVIFYDCIFIIYSVSLHLTIPHLLPAKLNREKSSYLQTIDEKKTKTTKGLSVTIFL